MPAARRGHRDGTGGVPSRRVHIGHPQYGSDHADGGVAISYTIHHKWDIVRGTGMEVSPIT